MNVEQFEVKRNCLSETRIISGGTPTIDDGQILTKVDRFALSANNITYGIVGDKLGYWKFFPVVSGWGIIPVWGFADVVESRHADIETGERLYGYFPMSTHLVMRPGKLKASRLFDAVTHRAELPLVYNSYVRTNKEESFDASMEDEQMLLFPLYATSFCLYDFLQDNDYFGASQVIIPSASSKTAIGLAYALKADSGSPMRLGLTSSGNRIKVESLGLYDLVATYDELDAIDNAKPTVIVDMSGNGTVLSDLHALLGENMKFTSNVGVTHYDANEMGPHFIHERSAMFFAPSHIQKRTQDWGPGEFEKKAYRFWRDASIKSREWLVIEHHDGMDALVRIYRKLLEGKTSPDQGIIVSL